MPHIMCSWCITRTRTRPTRVCYVCHMRVDEPLSSVEFVNALRAWLGFESVDGGRGFGSAEQRRTKKDS